MEENKVKKIRLSTLFLLLAIIMIIVIGIFMYKFYHKKMHNSSETTNVSHSMENIITTNANNNSVSNNTISFTDEQVKTTLSNYLELRAHANCDSLLETLTEKGKINYNAFNNTILNDGTVITTIKFYDYKNAMLNYVSEDEFEKNWNSTQYFSENSDGYLTKLQGGGGLRVYTIKNIVKNNNSTYSAKTTSTVDNDPMSEDEDFTFSIKSYRGNCVIDSIK